MRGRLVHVPLQRMVAVAPNQSECVPAVAVPLARALQLDVEWTLNVTRGFARSSTKLVRESIARARTAYPAFGPPIPYPNGPLQPAACAGPLDEGLAAEAQLLNVI